MGVSIPNELAAEWYNFVDNGLTRPITFIRMGPPNYDGNVVVQNPLDQIGPIDAIWLDFPFSIRQASIRKTDDSTILSTDKKIVISALELPVAPALTDKIVDDSSIVWSIIGIGGDPATAHYEFHVRPFDR